MPQFVTIRRTERDEFPETTNVYVDTARTLRKFMFPP